MGPYFKSLDPRYKSPVGAVEEQTAVHLKVILPRSLHCSSVDLVVNDDDVNFTKKFSMFWCGIIENECEAWECHFKPAHAGLFFYKFELLTCFGKKQIAKTSLLRGTCHLQEVCENLPMFQLTAYKKGFNTPDWLSGGIMYQIFPDRFFFSGEKKSSVPNDRILRDDWDGVPFFKPDSNNEVKNNDYFCGDLKGIESKIDYLKSLGVSCIYLNPIFEAHSNHRYNTADYSKIDPLLGTIDDFKLLCKKAEENGIKIMLDGVFNHTGDDSVYFNKELRYSSLGAYNSKSSKFFSWYKFINWPNEYFSWWGFSTLPEIDETNQDYIEYITGKSGIVSKWLKDGASAWRLDVADELPDDFIKKIRISAKDVSEENLVLGEVWEDATTKFGFGKRRRYFLGEELDSVMNYPFRDAILKFLLNEDAEGAMEQILSIIENYPKPVIKNLMNILGTHDTRRIITKLVGSKIGDHDKQWQSEQVLSKEQRSQGIKLMKLVSAIQYTLPGVPCIYYGDEVGMEGYKDPFCRRCYPWGNENADLLNWYKRLGEFRNKHTVFKEGDFIPICAEHNFLAYARECQNSSVVCVFNASDNGIDFHIPPRFKVNQCFSKRVVDDELIFIPAKCCEILF